MLGQTGVMAQLEVVIESGIIGGVAAPGPYFGCSVQPDQIISAAVLFRKIYSKPLDVVTERSSHSTAFHCCCTVFPWCFTTVP